MKHLNVETISSTYHIGSKISLTNSWHDKNVILPNSKMFYILDGEIVVEFKNFTITAKKGDMMLIPAGIKHDFHLSSKAYAQKYWFHFDFILNGSSFFDKFTFPFCTHVGINNKILKLFENVINKSKSINPIERITASSSLHSLVAYYFENVNYKDKNSTETDEIDKAIDYVKKNYVYNPSLEEIATKANLSPNYFIKKFKQRTGLSPLRYVNVLKIEKAKYLLEQTDLPVNKIMEDLGFFDSAYFSKLFKKYCGFSPLRYREVTNDKTHGN